MNQQDNAEAVWKQSVAAEVAARYGVKVDPARVQHVARGVSGEDHSQSAHWRHGASIAINAWRRGRRLRGLLAFVVTPGAETHEATTRRMLREGATVGEIARALGITKNAAAFRIKRMGLHTVRSRSQS